MIDLTGVDLVKFAQKAYDLSVPQGLGLLHFEDGGLSEAEAKEITKHTRGDVVLDMDYVKGRACKMTVFSENDEKKGLFMHDAWYDHTNDQLKELLSAFDIKPSKTAEHGCACNCVECQTKHQEPEARYGNEY